MKKTMFYLSVIASIFVLSADLGGARTMLSEKPYLTLKLNTEGCDYEIQVNGVVVLFEVRERSISVELPINHWLRSGENEIKILVWYAKNDPEGRRAKANVTLQVRQAGSSSSANVPVASIRFNGSFLKANKSIEGSSPSGKFNSRNKFVSDKNGDVAVSEIVLKPMQEEPGIEISRTVSMPLPFPEWGFFKEYIVQPEIELTDQLAMDLSNEIFPIYKKIQEGLENKNIDSILPLFEERNRELDKAFYYESGKMAKDLGTALRNAANDPERELLIMKSDSLDIFLSPNRRLVRLARPGGGGAIVFNYTDGSAHESYDIVLRKEGKKWIITR